MLVGLSSQQYQWSLLKSFRMFVVLLIEILEHFRYFLWYILSSFRTSIFVHTYESQERSHLSNKIQKLYEWSDVICGRRYSLPLAATAMYTDGNKDLKLYIYVRNILVRLLLYININTLSTCSCIIINPTRNFYVCH